MRTQTTRLLGVLAIGGAMLAATACLPGGDSEKTAACQAMVEEIGAVPSKASQHLSNPGAAAQVYSDAAAKVRAEGRKAGSDVQEAAEQVAADLEELAQVLRDAGSGNLRMPDTSKLISSGAKLRDACNA